MKDVLNIISENNNEYRKELTALNKQIDEKTTNLVGDCVTLSGYVVDFSNSIMVAKEKLVVPIGRIIESFAIKDLRNVESVNEQFIEKINYKFENADLNSKESKEEFNSNLSNLLNEKYLQIVNIKRTPFFNKNNENDEINSLIDDFEKYLKQSASFNDAKLNNLLTTYKKDIYGLVDETLNKINDLYLNNFIKGVSNEIELMLSNEISQDVDKSENSDSIINVDNNSESITFDAPVIPESVDIPFSTDNINLDNVELDNKVETSQNDSISTDNLEHELPSDIFLPTIEKETNLDNSSFDIEPLSVPEVEPIEVNDELLNNNNKPDVEPKKIYDVEEILKIAKSPVASQQDYELVSDNSVVSTDENKISNFELDFDEKELVEEMISRLTKRLDEINERQLKCDDLESKLKDDDAFVNNLIESANSKSKELDEFEEKLRNKEKELFDKQEQLSKRINEVLPFANAVLKNENES